MSEDTDQEKKELLASVHDYLDLLDVYQLGEVVSFLQRLNDDEEEEEEEDEEETDEDLSDEGDILPETTLDVNSEEFKKMVSSVSNIKLPKLV